MQPRAHYRCELVLGVGRLEVLASQAIAQEGVLTSADRAIVSNDATVARPAESVGNSTASAALHATGHKKAIRDIVVTAARREASQQLAPRSISVVSTRAPTTAASRRLTISLTAPCHDCASAHWGRGNRRSVSAPAASPRPSPIRSDLNRASATSSPASIGRQLGMNAALLDIESAKGVPENKC